MFDFTSEVRAKEDIVQVVILLTFLHVHIVENIIPNRHISENNICPLF